MPIQFHPSINPQDMSSSSRAQAPNSSEALPEYTDSDAQALLGYYPPPPAAADPLPLPLALPQVRHSYDSAFLRAYNPDLEHSGIFQEDWLKFIDGLNIAIVSLGGNQSR